MTADMTPETNAEASAAMSPEMTAFFTLHRDLPREGPGEPEDVHWAVEQVDLPARAEIADVACGPGSDIGALRAALPQGHVTALDKVAHYVEAARGRFVADGNVTLLRADMSVIANQYDLIWCAGAIYFLGVTEALRSWRKALRPGGVVAFSEPVWLTDAPSEGAKAFWADYPAISDSAGITSRVEAAGYEVIATRILSDDAWENYYTPLEARIEKLRPGAEGELAKVLDADEAEIAGWRAHRGEFGYQLTVVRPA